MFKNIMRIIPKDQLKIISCRTKYTVPDLNYDYNALEPVISADIMQVHHLNHHAAYVNNLNITEEKFLLAQANKNLSEMAQLTNEIKFNGGGHINHSIFWTILTPKGTSEPSGELGEAIKRDFGSFSKMVKELSNLSAKIKGSGWGWLGYNKQYNRVELAACDNQDPLLATTGLYPLFGIDVWEHAYHSQYKDKRIEYINNIFSVANWRKVEELYIEAKNKV